MFSFSPSENPSSASLFFGMLLLALPSVFATGLLLTSSVGELSASTHQLVAAGAFFCWLVGAAAVFKGAGMSSSA